MWFCDICGGSTEATNVNSLANTSQNDLFFVLLTRVALDKTVGTLVSIASFTILLISILMR